MQFFPAMDRSQFAVEVSLPEGSALEKTEAILESLEKDLMEDQRITNVATFVGSGSPRFHTLYAPHMPAKNYGQMMVNTLSNDATIEILDEYSAKYIDAFPGAKVKWKQIAMENFSAPIEVRISGDNITALKNAEKQVARILSEHENTTWVRNNWKEMRQGISIELDKNKANRMGYAKSFITASLMTSLNGIPVTTMWEGDYPIDVILSKEEDLKDDIRDLENQHVSSPLTLESLPLRTVAKLTPEWTEGCVVRRNGVRTLTVQADVQRGIIYSTVFKDIQPKIEELDLPDGINISYGGDQETTEENIIPLIYALGTSIILILFILLLQFKTLRRAMLIMSTMLLSLPGAAFGLHVVGYPFSMTAFIGVIGLMGITVRNGIILIDYAMQLVTKENYCYKEAAIAAGKRRMRPIFLTSMAAAMGVVPMIISNSPLWGPLGTVICFGLIFGMILTLFVVPVLYWRSTTRESYNAFGGDCEEQKIKGIEERAESKD
jgi:multidrug efflux pump subunit AcrB